jgi:hypothetical protein
MNLTQMLREAEADLRKADSEVELTQAEIQRAQEANAAARQRQANMRATYDWLSQRLKDHSDDDLSASVAESTSPQVKQTASIPAQESDSAVVADSQVAPTSKRVFGKPVPQVTLSSLTEEALEKLGRAATTREVRIKLQEDGHQYDQDQVRHALKYLARKKSSPVENPKLGVWQLRRTEATSLSPEGQADRPALNGHREES